MARGIWLIASAEAGLKLWLWWMDRC